MTCNRLRRRLAFFGLAFAVAAGTPAGAAPIDIDTMAGTDVAITVAGPTEPITPGTSLKITITVTNAGAEPADDVVARVPLPSNAHVDDVPHAALAPVCGRPGGGEWLCSYGQLLPGESHTSELEVTLSAMSVAGQAQGIAVVTSTTIDLNPANNTAYYVLDVADPRFQLATEIAAPGEVAPGAPFTATVTVTNSGVSAARNVVVSIPAASGSTVNAGSAAGASCEVSADATAVLCRLPDVAPGAAVAFTISVTAPITADITSVSAMVSVNDLAGQGAATRQLAISRPAPAVIGSDVRPSSLAFTGSESTPFVVAGAVLVLVGSSLVLFARRRANA